MRTLAVIAVLGMLILVGCQKIILVSVENQGDRVPTFVLKTSGKVELHSFMVFETTSDGKATGTVWSIISEDGAPRNVSRIVYGIAPNGFKEANAAKPLHSGVTYNASASMPKGEGGGGVIFTVE